MCADISRSSQFSWDDLPDLGVPGKRYNRPRRTIDLQLLPSTALSSSFPPPSLFFSFSSFALSSLAVMPPPAAIAPGPAGLTFFGAAAPFLAPALGAGLALDGADASSSASNRAFSALRASSARRFSSLSSLDLEDLAPSCHLDASLRSWILYG